MPGEIMTQTIWTNSTILPNDKLIIDYRAREWCKLPYPDHPHGCPNYNHKSTCPPEVCLIEDFIDPTRPIWLVIEEFDLGGHIAKMLTLNPHWSNRQARCVLYWQGTVNKKLELSCQTIATQHPGSHYTICPEAMGVDVIHTVKQFGVPIMPRPVNQVFKVGLVCYGWSI